MEPGGAASRRYRSGARQKGFARGFETDLAASAEPGLDAILPVEALATAKYPTATAIRPDLAGGATLPLNLLGRALKRSLGAAAISAAALDEAWYFG